MNTLPCGRKKDSYTHKNQPKMPDWKPVLDQFLKKKKLRITEQRDHIATVIFAKNSHFEVQKLIKEIEIIHPDIGPATVYRTVKTLCDANLLKESLQSREGVTLYEIQDEDHHDHIICTDCGEIFEFHDESIEEAQNKAIKKMGFTQTNHKHVIYVKCALLNKK